MKLLDGKLVSEEVKSRISLRCGEFKQKWGRTPCLAVILVGSDPASQVYVRNKGLACKKVGMLSKEIKLPAEVDELELKNILSELNNDTSVDGILVQLPLPKTLDKDKIISWIDPKKDADGLCPQNLGLLMAGIPRVKPCTPNGVMEILKHYNINPAGMNAVVVGRSQIVGLPMALLLTQANATVTICHSKTKDLKQKCLEADLVVAAAGQNQLIKADSIKKGAIVIDVGIHRNDLGGGKSKLSGDVNFESVKEVAGALTPVPGGVGPMTIAMLLSNTLDLAEARHRV